jgi:hypothetical protein
MFDVAFHEILQKHSFGQFLFKFSYSYFKKSKICQDNALLIFLCYAVIGCKRKWPKIPNSFE